MTATVFSADEPPTLRRFRRLGRSAAGLVALALGACSGSQGPSGSSSGPSIQLASDLEIRSVARDVWLHTSWRDLPSGSRFPSHGLMIRHGSAAVLIDTAWGDEPTKRLAEWIENRLELRLQWAVVTHFHDDRLGGAAFLTANGVDVYALPLTRELAGEAGGPLEPLPPLQAGEAADLGPLEVYYPGAAHTRDNLVVWIPAAAVLFGGCAVRPAAASGLGNTADGVVENWPDAIRRIAQRDSAARVVIPSHGRPGGPQLLDHTLHLLGAGPPIDSPRHPAGARNSYVSLNPNPWPTPQTTNSGGCHAAPSSAPLTPPL